MPISELVVLGPCMHSDAVHRKYDNGENFWLVRVRGELRCLPTRYIPKSRRPENNPLIAHVMDLRKQLEGCWSRETAYPKWQEKWNPRYPSLGQCYVTALIVQDIFGGRLIRNRRGFHIWNRLPDGTEVDLTGDQLGGIPPFPFYAGIGELLPKSYGAKRTTNRRYKLLKERLEALLDDL